MVVRKQAALPKKYIYNAAVIALFVVGGAFAFRSGFQTEVVPGCAERATLAAPLPVTQSGARVSLVDLRARTGGAEWGLDDSLTMGLSDDGREAILTVAFDGDEAAMFKSQRRRLEIENRTSGVGFDWTAEALADRHVGCLAYAVQVPDDFPQVSAGVLPGLVVSEQRGVTGVESTGESLAFPMRWHPQGRMGLRIQRSTGVPGLEFNMDVGAAALTPGRWHKIEQEVTLGTPGQADGQVRVWVNGALLIDRQGLTFSKSEAPLRFDRVQAHVHFVDRNAIWQPAEQKTTLSIRGLTLYGF